MGWRHDPWLASQTTFCITIKIVLWKLLEFLFKGSLKTCFALEAQQIITRFSNVLVYYKLYITKMGMSDTCSICTVQYLLYWLISAFSFLPLLSSYSCSCTFDSLVHTPTICTVPWGPLVSSTLHSIIFVQTATSVLASCLWAHPPCLPTLLH